MNLVSIILVPVDFSPESYASVEYAASFAKALQSTVTLFHVRELPSAMNSIVPGTDGVADADTDRSWRRLGSKPFGRRHRNTATSRWRSSSDTAQLPERSFQCRAGRTST